MAVVRGGAWLVVVGLLVAVVASGERGRVARGGEER